MFFTLKKKGMETLQICKFEFFFILFGRSLRDEIYSLSRSTSLLFFFAGADFVFGRETEKHNITRL